MLEYEPVIPDNICVSYEAKMTESGMDALVFDGRITIHDIKMD